MTPPDVETYQRGHRDGMRAGVFAALAVVVRMLDQAANRCDWDAWRVLDETADELRAMVNEEPTT